MESQQKLVDYISEQLQQGKSPDIISLQLAQIGWQNDQVKQAFLSVQASVLPSHMQHAAVSTETMNNVPAPQANGRRRGRIKMGWQIFKHSLKLLNGNRYLLRYFVMTWVLVILINSVLIALVWFAAPDFFFGSNSHWYLIVFISYLIIYCVVNFYAAALARNILDIYKGERKPYVSYLKLARARFWPIFVYSLISAVIGTLLQFIIEKLGWLGRIVSLLLGTAWSISTMFVLPIIMDTPSSAPSAIKQSFRLFKQTWGEGITAKVTAGTPIAIFQILLVFIFSTLLFPAALLGGLGLILPVLFVYLSLSLSLAIIGSYASSFINAALYYYAVNHEVPPGFDADMLNQVFIKSKRQLKKEAKI